MLNIFLVQQGAWDMKVDSMPLAIGYLKAHIDSNLAFKGEVNVRICNFRGGESLQGMAKELFSGEIPDVLAFSVLGWNYRSFSVLAETFKQFNPEGITVFGGNHVAKQSSRVFRENLWVDVVVNGEGEETFSDLIEYLLQKSDQSDFSPDDVQGISYRASSGKIATTPEKARIENLDSIASPFLSGAIPMLDHLGKFRYDVALMETNRGCPYKCSFCYWGGAVGQAMRTFSADRLAEEVDLFGFHGAPSIVLCDSNFGMLESDEEFIEIVAKTKERYGYPENIVTSWAKNKSQRFYNIVRKLKAHDLHGVFTLALQTLNDEALDGMLRRNMKVNQWESLADWLADEGLDCYGELIWGAPGETPESFLRGYDRLAKKVSRVAVYPMLLLPNTSYVEQRELHGFVTVRGDSDDFEYILANRTVSVRENLEMQKFVFWARMLGEQQYFHFLWILLRDVIGFSQSATIASLRAYIEDCEEVAAKDFIEMVPIVADSPSVSQALRVLHTEVELQKLIECWWHEEMVPKFPAAWRGFAESLFVYENWTRQLYSVPGEALPPRWRLVRQPDGTEWYQSDAVEFPYNIPQILEDWPRVLEMGVQAEVSEFIFSSRPGFYYNLDNYEMAAQHRAVCRSSRLSSQSAVDKSTA